MATRTSLHVKSMQRIDWDADAGREGASPHMETLVKETATLQRVLTKHMPPVTVGLIMRPVFGSYREQWGSAFRAALPQTEAGKNR